MTAPLRWVLSSLGGGERLAPQPSPAPRGNPHAAPGESRLWIDTTRRFQRLLGFGGAFTEAAATTWQRLPEDLRESFLREHFDPDPAQGHGYTLCRVHMGSCDFALGNYAHAEVSGDTALAHFSIERDRQALIPMIRDAQRVAGRPIRLLASPWSPPAWMKDTGRMNEGGRLRPECRDAWARCFVRFIQAYADEGTPIWGVSVQNEPEAHQRWDSCLYSAEDERDFVRDHLGPALHAAGLGDVKVVVWDHNRDVLVERASVMYRDAEAAKYVWGAGFHWYGEDHFDQVRLVHDAWPDKQLLFTEGCQEGGPHHGSWALAERYARSIVNDLNRWTVGWIDWNLLLDDEGGPNHVGNLCSAPVLATREADGLQHQSSFFALGHFARHIRPGAQRVLAASSREALLVTAFVHDDGELAVVVVNLGDGDAPIRLAIDGRAWSATMPAHAIATFTQPAANSRT